MITIKQAAAEFLTKKRIAVTGVSREPQTHAADEVEGDRCHPDLKSIPGGVEAVVIGTRPEAAEDTVRECVALGIRQVWMHRLFGSGSVSEKAAAFGREHGITVIEGGCPLLFGLTADTGHKVMRVALTPAGRLLRRVEVA
ncbi:CoA-binding protein [Streptomyces sp. NBC_00490]|uniref:CoA-binding protein n=1 Tax=Streptomyces sp. NBC_00490 TaxID=2903657 RepID=UPI002E19C0B7